MGLVGDVIGAVAGVGQSLIDRKTQRLNIEAQNRGNMELSKYAYSKDIEMWNKSNDYNTPAAQMKRYTEAGLNPNLIYGNGGSAGNTSTSTPSFKAPEFRFDQKPLNIASAVSAFQDFRLKEAQIDAVGIQNENNKWIALKNKVLAERESFFDDYKNAQLINNSRLVGYQATIKAEEARRIQDRINADINQKLMSTLLAGRKEEYQTIVNQWYKFINGSRIGNEVISNFAKVLLSRRFR